MTTHVLILGPLEVLVDGRVVSVPRGHARALLAMLALRPGEVISSDRLLDGLRGEAPPPTAVQALHGLVSTLRDRLEPGHGRRSAPGLLITVLPELGAVQLNKLDKAMLRAWLARRTAGHLKPASVHQAYRALRRVLTAAVENDILVRNPLDGIKPPRLEPQEMRFLTPGEVARLADVIDVRYRAFVAVGAYCGLRLGEMAGLRRHRVDLLHRHLQVVEQLGRDEKRSMGATAPEDPIKCPFRRAAGCGGRQP